MPMGDWIKRQKFNIILILGILSLLVLFTKLYYQFELSFLNISLLAIGLGSVSTGVSSKMKLPKGHLKKMDFIYYMTAMLGVVFLFGAQQVERSTALRQLQLVTVERSLETVLLEQSKLERMRGNPDHEIEASINAILNWLYVESREAFADTCERSKRSGNSGPDNYLTCQSEDLFNQTRDKSLARFRESAGAYFGEESYGMEIRTTAIGAPQAFFNAIKIFREELDNPQSFWREVDRFGDARQAMKDLELALSVQGDGERFRNTWENNQVRLGELEFEKRDIKTAMEREAALAEKGYLHAGIRWLVYNIWPILLIIALSIKLAKTAQD